MRIVIRLLAALAALTAVGLSAAQAAEPPRAISVDPPYDAANPATTLSVEIPSHGAMMNGIVYRPSGAGPFPLVVLIHGLPGNEQNLDLAQALRRAGWAVLTFHFRGAFGSEGTFTLDGAIEDADAAMAYIRAPKVAAAWKIDPARVVIVGHSLGGLAAARAARLAPDRLATVLIAPWDPSILAGILRPMSHDELAAAAVNRWGDTTHGRLTGLSADQIAAQIVDHGEHWRLEDAAPPLATRPVLIITATRDLPSSKAAGLKAALAAHNAPLDAVEIDTDHVFNDRRIALEVTILDWLAKLPGAPKAP